MSAIMMIVIIVMIVTIMMIVIIMPIMRIVIIVSVVMIVSFVMIVTIVMILSIVMIVTIMRIVMIVSEYCDDCGKRARMTMFQFLQYLSPTILSAVPGLTQDFWAVNRKFGNYTSGNNCHHYLRKAFSQLLEVHSRHWCSCSW